MAFINKNGELLDADLPAFTINNRAFRYGDAIFETIRVVNGNICFLDKHLERMLKGMNTLHLDIPSDFNIDFFEIEIKKLLLANSINEGGRIRITIYRHEGGYYTPSTNEADFVIEAIVLEHNNFVLNTEGLSVDLYEDQKLVINKLSGVKTNNCLTHVLAALHKKDKGLDECILLNELNSVAECISSNLFVGFNGVLYTPSINQGIIPGIMRQVMIDIARENGMEVQECPLNPQVLLRADEMFLTNAINGIKWAVAYRSKRYYSKTSKLLIGKLNEKISNLEMDLQGN